MNDEVGTPDRSNQEQDFARLDPSQFAIRKMHNEIQQVLDTFNDAKKFGMKICAALEDITPVRKAHKELVKELILDDKEIKDWGRENAKEVQNENWKAKLGKLGIGAWTFVVIILTSVANFIIPHFFNTWFTK